MGLSSYKIDDVLLDDFEHRIYFSFIVGVINSIIDSSFFVTKIHRRNIKMKSKMKKETTLIYALIPLLFLIGSLFYAIQIAEIDIHLPILISAFLAAIVAIFGLNYSWSEIEEGMVETIKMALGAIIILMIIGMVIGTWIQSGVVPTMIFYGLKILSPGVFLPATLIICAVVSTATGSSWTTAATVGIALIGVGEGLGIPKNIVAGAIISGSYMGDKMSPLSDTTNLAPAMAGATLFEHIKHMLYTTVPSFIISIVLFGIIGIKYVGVALNTKTIDGILNALSGSFNINPLLLLVPVIVIIAVIMKVPAIPGLFGGAVLGGIAGMIFQGVTLGSAIKAFNYGYEGSSGLPFVDSLLNRGGMQSMMWTVSLIFCAMILGGIMEKTQMLSAIALKILSYAHSTGNLILVTILTPIFVNFVAGDQYLSIVIPGRMFKKVYEERGLHAKNLSRSLEDSGTLTSSLIPWNTGGAYMITTLGLAPWTYVPYCFLNLINPIIAIIYGYTGFSIEKIDKVEEVKAEVVVEV
ncbi:MAG: Na+/H+ antiporter NhaC [Psychrilyobacter sp.]|uniref:Na+/H+ antiporter NhaC n=1 Tax=Psychrilyobacter sp. TaxID=2586924 RepID=UPI003C70BF02